MNFYIEGQIYSLKHYIGEEKLTESEWRFITYILRNAYLDGQIKGMQDFRDKFDELMKK